MSGTAFPILITTQNSARHELLFIETRWTFSFLGRKICDIMAVSPNCSSHQVSSRTTTHLSEGPAVPPGKIKALRIRWARDATRDAPGWPEMTVVTSANHEAVLQMLHQRTSAGRSDVLEAEFSNWSSGEEGLGIGGERLPTYGEVDGGLAP